MVLSVRAAKAEWVSLLEVTFVVVLNGLILFGFYEMGAFQRQERPWRAALDRAKLLALVNLGLSPFLYWANRVPSQEFFSVAVLVLGASGVLFLFNLNVVVKRLGAMLPDETLRLETRQFTAINRALLVVLFVSGTLYIWLARFSTVAAGPGGLSARTEHYAMWGMVFLILFPLAMTMALIWKTKEVILESVFSASQSLLNDRRS